MRHPKHPRKIDEQIVFNDKLLIEKATFEDENGHLYSRLRLNRPKASAILLVDKERDTVILTRQFRYPVSAHTTENLLEAAAGKVDEGETPEQAAIREVEEETGYRITSDNLHLLVDCYASPGYTTEILYIYVAYVSASSKLSSGGGLEEEHESIELVEMSLNDFRKAIRNGEIKDAKTCLAGLYLNLLS